jgi:hypothetical protein
MVWKNGVSPVHLRAKKMAMMMNEARKTRYRWWRRLKTKLVMFKDAMANMII